MSLNPGQRLKSYVIKNQIARGGMGEIWRAWDEVNGKYVALKAITDNLFIDPNFTKRFLDEGRRHLKLKHPNIVPVLDVFYAENQNFLFWNLSKGNHLVICLVVGTILD